MSDNERAFSNALLESYYDLCNQNSSNSDSCDNSSSDSCDNSSSNTCNPCNRSGRNYRRSYSCESSSSSTSCSGTNYDVQTRIQFTIVQSPQNISALLTAIANEDIDIDGYLLQAINANCTLLSFAIGTAEEQSAVNLAIVRCLFKKLCICYLENEILRVSFPTIGAGVLANFYSALISNDISVSTSYPAQGEDAIYIEPSCIEGLCNVL